jgi:hypothetical protein
MDARVLVVVAAIVYGVSAVVGVYAVVGVLHHVATWL